jgi:pyruvate formate lyase activating enzyme
MCDLKLFDSEKHCYWTGKGNQKILENIQKLDNTGVSYSIRTPVIPEVNDRIEELEQLSNFITGLKRLESYELLPFHPLASYKYQQIGMNYAFRNVKEIPLNEFAELKNLFEINRQYHEHNDQ